MNKELIKRIEEIFEEKISAKTGWGKNEIMIRFKEAVSEACLELIDNGHPQSFRETMDNEKGKPEWLTDSVKEHALGFYYNTRSKIVAAKYLSECEIDAYPGKCSDSGIKYYINIFEKHCL